MAKVLKYSPNIIQSSCNLHIILLCISFSSFLKEYVNGYCWKHYIKWRIFMVLRLNDAIEYMDHLHSFCLWTHNGHNVALVLLNTTTLLNHILVQRPFNFPCIIPTDWNISNFGQHVTPTERLLKRKFNVEGTIYTVCLENFEFEIIWCSFDSRWTWLYVMYVARSVTA